MSIACCGWTLADSRIHGSHETMNGGPVGFIDSGIGGLPYLAAVRRVLPGIRLAYAADRERFPYGDKRPAEIIEAVLSLAGRLIEREHPRLIVVACNTASVVALDELRRHFRLPFVGTVPAIKPAAAWSHGRRIGILATQRTVEGDYLRGLVERFAGGCEVVGIPANDLVAFVENDLYRASATDRAARAAGAAARVRDAGVDTVVLGCTHFLHLELELREAFGPHVLLIDSRDGVARQTARLAGGPVADVGPRQPPDAFYLTGPGPFADRHLSFARSFGLEPAGSL
jgi:glutamate racemase